MKKGTKDFASVELTFEMGEGEASKGRRQAKKERKSNSISALCYAVRGAERS